MQAASIFDNLWHQSRRRLLLATTAGVGAAAVIAAASVSAQDTTMPRILSDAAVRAATPLPDFSYAGYGFGTAAIPDDAGTVIAATAHGVVADDGIDDSQALQRALTAARAVQGRVTVRLPAGRVQLTEVLRLDRSELIFEGAGQGEGGTELYMPRPLRVADRSQDFDELRAYLVRENKIQREPDQNLNHYFTEFSWSGGFLRVGVPGGRPVSYDGSRDVADRVITEAASGDQFSRTLTVADGSSLRAGQIIRIQWFARAERGSAIIRSLYGDTNLPVGSHHWSFPARAAVVQSTRIIARDGNTITLGDPLLHAVSAEQAASVTEWQPLTNVGIQNMRLTFPDSPWFGHHLEDGYNGIYMTGVFDGWIRNLAIHNADSGILTDDAANLTIAGVRTTGEHRAHYAVHVGAVHNALVRDVEVSNPVIHPLTFNTRSTRSVFHNATVLRDAVFDQHSGSNHSNLFDQVTMHIAPRRAAGGNWRYRLWEGGGAGYWKPGHGLMNTAWNVRLVMPDNVPEDATVELFSGLEGPGKRIVGMYGNRRISISYDPAPYIEGTNVPQTAVPSLYLYQMARRQR